MNSCCPSGNYCAWSNSQVACCPNSCSCQVGGENYQPTSTWVAPATTTYWQPTTTSYWQQPTTTYCNECQQHTTYCNQCAAGQQATTTVYQNGGNGGGVVVVPGGGTTTLYTTTNGAQSVYNGNYCSTQTAVGNNLPATAAGGCGTILIVEAPKAGAAERVVLSWMGWAGLVVALQVLGAGVVVWR